MATELAKAYVQIVPSARGIKGSITNALSGEADAAGSSAGQSFGSKMMGTIKNVIVAAGIGKALSATIAEGAALEQSIGGIETLFKESADKVKQNAAEAYRTAGMSANEYMELTTSFSASLLQSVAGDTTKAADIADMAMQDMSDNANKMGTSMEDIKNAYQGFAKQNYTMLDNLKLGYGGTKTEMERLLADAQKITGVKYDINNLSDVYSAIHVIQEELDITGTTAKEAASTISGSFASMKAAFKNVLGQLTLGQDVGPALQALAQTVTTFLVGNLLPAVWNILSALPGALVTFIQTAVPQLVSTFMQFLTQMTASISAGTPQMVNAFIEMASEALIQFTWTIIEALPQVLETGTKILKSVIGGIASELPGIVSVCLDAITGFIGAIIEALPHVLETGTKILKSVIGGIASELPGIVSVCLDAITGFIGAIIEALPHVLQSGTEILMSLIDGIRTALPQMLVAAAQAILSMVKGLIQNFPQILSAGFDMIVNLIKGIGNALPDIIAAAGEIAGMLWNTILETDWIQLGKDIIGGLINGIGAMAGALWDAAVNIARSALDAIKSFFGIASPSKLMRDEVGKFIPLGIAAGIERNTHPISKAMRGISELTSGTMNADIVMGLRYGHPAVPALAYAGGYGGTTNFYQTINTHDSLSESELTREAENLLERSRWKNP